ncbi:MAG: PKD domain-containing protein [Candidatus Thermoplasmatota archaeon]
MKKHLSVLVIGSLSLCIMLSGCIENKPPSVAITASPTAGVTPLTVSFIGNATDETGTIESYLWDFGDGNTSQEQNPTHIFTTVGTYNVSLTSTDNGGLSAIDTVLITVIPTHILFSPSAEADTGEISNETILYCEKYIILNDTEISTLAHNEIYLQFNFSDIPDDIQVDAATMMMFITDLGFYEKQGYEKGVSYPKFGNSGYLFIAVYECNSTSWDSASLNSSNAPSYNRTPVDYQQITSYEGSGENIWISWNVTRLLQKIVSNTTKQVSLVITIEPDPYQSGVPLTYGYASFFSTEGALAQGTENYPHLLANFSTRYPG